MKDLKAAWADIRDYSTPLEIPPSRWKENWSTHALSAKRLYNAVRWRKPEIIVETGTFEGLGTYVMAKASQDNGGKTRIFTIDYDGDPEVTKPDEDWAELRRIRDENLELARKQFPDVEITFLNGDSRQVLSRIFPSQADHWDFFFQDSMHFMSGILDEWRIMKPFARKESVVIFDDVCLDWKKLPGYLTKKNDFCLHFVFEEAFKGGWIYRSTGEGRGQFWAQKP